MPGGSFSASFSASFSPASATATLDGNGGAGASQWWDLLALELLEEQAARPASGPLIDRTVSRAPGRPMMPMGQEDEEAVILALLLDG